MSTNPDKRPVPKPPSSVIDWLLDSDPSIRWQAMRDLTDAPAEQVAAERARVATEGWGAKLLEGQSADGFWGVGTPNPEWVTLQTLLLLRDMGLDPRCEQARRVVERVRGNVRWQGVLPQDAAWHGKPLFKGEVEPCINGRVWQPARTLARTYKASSSGCCASRWPMAAGTASRSGDRRAARSTPRSVSWRGYLSTSGLWAARPP